MPTLFEKIIAGELPATVRLPRFEGDRVSDIRPAAPVHILDRAAQAHTDDG